MSRVIEARAALDAARAERAEREARAARSPSLFDPPAEPDLDAAIASVEHNASSQWIGHALAAVRRAATVHAELTTETVWQYVTEQVHDHRAMGAVMRTAARRGWIKPTGEYVTAGRPDWHQRPCRVWQSLIVGIAS